MRGSSPNGHLLTVVDVVNKHKQVYQQDGQGDENALGTAAATQALKMFNQGGSFRWWTGCVPWHGHV